MRWMKLYVITSSCSVLINGQTQGGWLGSETTARTLSYMMNLFADFSSLQLNRAKSSFVGFGLATEEILRYAQILALPIGTLPLRYLGLPLTDRCLRIQDWHPMVEKVEMCLGGWQGRLLSRGGRLVLVKAVFSAILMYFMLALWMPVGVRRCLKGAMRSFFWRAADLAKGGALVTSISVCRPFADGGLCMRHLQHANSVLLSKWVVRVMHPSEDMISHLFREAYGSTLDWGRMGHTSAWRFSHYCGSWGDLPAGPTILPAPVGDEADFKFWEDDWSGQGLLAGAFPCLYSLAPVPNVTGPVCMD